MPSSATSAAASTPPTVQRRAFASAEEALRFVLEQHPPRILAVGETHAPRGASVPSAAVRFSEQLLPILAPKSKVLVVEAWQPSNCDRAVEAKVQKANVEITEQQAETNTNEYLSLAHSAKARGLTPLPLRPSCEESAQIAARADAGDDIVAMLEVVTHVAERTLQAGLKNCASNHCPMVLSYGGALHNDLYPGEARAGWSFGPSLDAQTSGGYVELDLVVPEFIADTEVWNRLPWRPSYDRERHGDAVQLLWSRERSYTLVFAKMR